MFQRIPAVLAGFLAVLAGFLAVLGGFLVVTAVAGWGREQSPAANRQQPAAAAAIRAITSGNADAVDRIPADYAAVMRYRPVVAWRSGTPAPTRADGSCSSPFGGTPYHFTTACKQHDLGYDLLRYAADKGQPLGPWARKAVDAHFAQQMRSVCRRPGCGTMAGLYSAMVRFNSWRQGYGRPAFEPIGSFVAPIAAGLATTALLIALPLSAPRRPHRPALTGRTA